MSAFTIHDLETRVHERAAASAETSYTRKLLDKGVAHCAKKLGEEAVETALAAVAEDREHLIAEAADLIYHLLVVLEARGRVGGRAHTVRAGDLALDLGCGWLHSADENEWTRIALALGFAVDDLPPPWARPAHEANFSAAEQKDYWAAVERFYDRVDAETDSDRPMSDCFEPGGRWNAGFSMRCSLPMNSRPITPTRTAPIRSSNGRSSVRHMNPQPLSRSSPPQPSISASG